MDPSLLGIVFIPLAALLAPLLAMSISKFLAVPIVVFEIVLGILIGPDVLGFVENNALLKVFSQLGLATLFFMAGQEIDPSQITTRTGRRSVSAWGFSAVLAFGAGLLLGGDPAAVVVITIALTGTALGTIMPIMRDAGLTKGPLGTALSMSGAVGEFGPLIAISIFLSRENPLVGSLTILAFLLLAVVAFWIARKGPREWLRHTVQVTLRTSGQIAIRFVLLLLAALVTLALLVGVDFLLGAFTAGLLARVVLRASNPDELEMIEAKLEAVSFGFLVPIFFVATGVSFPLRTLLGDQQALLLVPVFILMMLVVRGVPAYFTPLPGTRRADRRTVAFFTATTLPIVIAVTDIGVANKAIDESFAAAMVGAGLITVLIFPVLALMGRQKGAEATPAPNT